MTGRHYVYLYRDPASDRVKYVGYGKDPTRAMSHAGASHNTELRWWLEQEAYHLDIAGPYRDEVEGMSVEAALISAIRPEFNVSPGTGPKFRPVGVPPELADRLLEPPLTASEVGIRVGGVLLVYITGGTTTKDGRQKPDPVTPEVEPIAINAEGWWLLGNHARSWIDDPESSPRVLAAVYGGNRRHRFVLGSFAVDEHGWRAVTPDTGSLWRIPLKDRTAADAHGLRGRRIDVTFGRPRSENYRWVDHDGVVQPYRHSTPP